LQRTRVRVKEGGCGDSNVVRIKVEDCGRSKMCVAIVIWVPNWRPK